MKALERFFGVVSYSRINDALSRIASELENSRNDIRKTTLTEMDELNPTKDGEKIQQKLLQMNRELTLSYEKERVLRDFINLFK